MAYWLARDDDNSLYLYKGKPIKSDQGWFLGNDHDGYIKLSRTNFPEVTLKNSPVKVDIAIIIRQPIGGK